MSLPPARPQVTDFLWPFKLTTPPHGVTQRPLHMLAKGECGVRDDDAFNQLVMRML